MNRKYQHRHAGRTLIILLVCHVIFSLQGISQETDTLEQVVVTGQFRPQPADQSIYKINVIGEKDFRMKAANNLADLLKTEAGYQLRSEGVLGDYIRIRGLTGEHIKILIDGMPVTGRVADRIDLGQLTLNNVDHVEIIEGPMSVVYGSNALAGAINIITSDYSDIKQQISARGYYESAGVYNLNASFARKIKNHTISISSSRNFFSGWSPVDTSRYLTWKPKLQYQAGVGYNYSRNSTKVSLNSEYLHEELRDPGALTIANLYEKALDGYHYTLRWNNRFSFVRKTSDNFTMNFQAGYSYYGKRKVTYLNDLVNLSKSLSTDSDLHDTTRFDMISVRGFISNIPGKKMEYQTGFDINYESASGKRTGGYRDLYDISGFMNFILRPLQSFSIQPGIRFMHNSDFKAPLIYGLSMKYAIPAFSLRASYARGFRAPSLKQLYLEFIDNNHEIHGNTELKPETAHNVGITFNYDLISDRNMLSFQLSTFYNSIRNAVQLAISTENPGWGKYFNIENSLYKTKGAELGITFRRSPLFSINAGTIATGRLRLGNQEYVWSTDFVASMTVRTENPSLQLAVFYKYTDEYMEFAGNYNEEGKLDGITQQFTSPYHMMDATVGKYFLRDRLYASAGIKNILNVRLVDSFGNLNIHGNIDNSAAIGYGRVFFVTLSLKLKKEQTA